MKLKTLKDITPIPGDMEVDTWTSTRALKKEAIKWVKELVRQNKGYTMIDYGMFVKFFNITEEDLR